jgi:predicted membrane protein
MCEKNCNQRENCSRSGVILLGVTCVLIGLILLAFNVGWFNPAFKSVVISWPMLLILLAVIGYIKRQRLFPTILLLVGVFFLLPRLESVYPGLLGGAAKDFTANFWSFLLIIIGLLLIFGFASNRRKKASFMGNVADKQSAASGTGGWISKNIVFSGSESVFLEPVFRGGDLDLLFGGIVIDLRKTTLPDTTVYLNVDAVCGGVTLYIPADWSVKSEFDSVFGGYSDKRPNATVAEAEGEKGSKLILQGSLIFSGCNVQ